MANATTRRQHPNAPLTPTGRRRMVGCVVEQGWTVEATASRFQVDAMNRPGFDGDPVIV